MKRNVLNLCLSFLGIFLLFSCHSGKTELVTVRVDPSKVVNTMQGGFGASMHAIEDSLPVSTDGGRYRSWGGSVWGGNPPAEDTARWDAIFRHGDWLGLDWCRVEIDHGMYEPREGIFSFSNKEMNILYRWLDFCQSRKVDVFLTEMWPDVKWLVHKNFLGDPVAELRSAPDDFEAWASGYAVLLDHLINSRKYTCIKWISVNNEPMEEWSWWKAADGSPQDILPGLQALRNEISKRNLPLALVATDGPFRYGIGDFDKYLPYIGAVVFHDYSSVFDWWDAQPYISHTEDALKEWKSYALRNNNLPVFMGEFGSFLYGIEKDTDGPARWFSLIHDAQLVLRLSNAGIDGMNRWSFVNRGDLDGQWQLIDTWDPVKDLLTDSVTPHPNSYFVYGLITRFTSKYSDVLHTEVTGDEDTVMVRQRDGSLKNLRHVYASTFRSPGNKNISLFITNDSEREKSLLVDLRSFAGMTFWRYGLDREAEGRSDIILDPLGNHQGGQIELKIKPYSIILLTTKHLLNDDMGIFAD